MQINRSPTLPLVGYVYPNVSSKNVLDFIYLPLKNRRVQWPSGVVTTIITVERAVRGRIVVHGDKRIFPLTMEIFMRIRV